MNKCPSCKCHLQATPLIRLAHVYKRNSEGEIIQVAYHASCLLGGSQMSRLASMANSFAMDIRGLIAEASIDDSELNDLFKDAEELITEAVKWIEPEAE